MTVSLLTLSMGTPGLWSKPQVFRKHLLLRVTEDGMQMAPCSVLTLMGPSLARGGPSSSNESHAHITNSDPLYKGKKLRTRAESILEAQRKRLTGDIAAEMRKICLIKKGTHCPGGGNCRQKLPRVGSVAPGCTNSDGPRTTSRRWPNYSKW